MDDVAKLRLCIAVAGEAPPPGAGMSFLLLQFEIAALFV
jgi:hypothetical protein